MRAKNYGKMANQTTPLGVTYFAKYRLNSDSFLFLPVKHCHRQFYIFNDKIRPMQITHLLHAVQKVDGAFFLERACDVKACSRASVQLHRDQQKTYLQLQEVRIFDGLTLSFKLRLRLRKVKGKKTGIPFKPRNIGK